MSDSDILTDARLSQAAYGSNNSDLGDIIDGWKPIAVKLGDREYSPDFSAQLFEKNGEYKVAFRGSETKGDLATNFAYGTNQWSPEFGDTVAFLSKAVQQMANEKFSGDTTKAIDLFSTTGHSQGGFESELAAMMFGIKGTSLDGMGAPTIADIYRSELTNIMIENGASDLVDRYATSGDGFLTRVYTVVGMLGAHYGTPQLSFSGAVTIVTSIAVSPYLAAVITDLQHPIGKLLPMKSCAHEILCGE